MEFEECLKLENLSEQSIKTYMYGFNRLSKLLKNSIYLTNPKIIITTINDLTIPLNSKKLLLVSAIKVFNVYELSTTLLIKYLDKLKLEITIDTDAKLHALVLPSLNDIVQHSKQQFKNGNWVSFIITYLLINYNFRNKDLLITITKNKNDIDDKNKNWIYITSTYIRIYINDYKTASIYGTKSIVLKSVKIITALNEFLDNELSKTLIPLDIGTNLGKFVMSHAYNNIGETIYFKIIVKSLATQGKVKKLATAGKYRGTNLDTIVSSYLS